MIQDRVEFMLDNICTPGISKEDFELHPGINILLQETVDVDHDKYEEEEEVKDLFDGMEVHPDESEAKLEDLVPFPIAANDSKRPLSYFAKVINGFTNQLYFMNEHSHDVYGGIRNIVSRAGARVLSSIDVASVDATKSLFSLIDLLVGQPQS